MESDKIYQAFRCSKCERRLNKPFTLNCKHLICRNCLESNIEYSNNSFL